MGSGKPHLNWVFMDAEEVAWWTKTEVRDRATRREVEGAGA